MWKCPKCGRTFKNTNQEHYCGELASVSVMNGMVSFISSSDSLLLVCSNAAKFFFFNFDGLLY